MIEYIEFPIAGAGRSLLVRVGKHFGCPGQDPELSPCLVPGRRWVVFQDAQAGGWVPAVCSGQDPLKSLLLVLS